MALTLIFSRAEIVDILNRSIDVMRHDASERAARLTAEVNAPEPTKRHACCDEEDDEPMTPEECARYIASSRERLEARVANKELIRDHLAPGDQILTLVDFMELTEGGRY